jgi:hypothetical protein
MAATRPPYVVFELTRSDKVSGDHDVTGERREYQGHLHPTIPRPMQRGFTEMDPLGQRYYRQAPKPPTSSPSAVSRWIPFIDELIRACVDEKIEDGRIDFVDDLTDVAPSVVTTAMM